MSKTQYRRVTISLDLATIAKGWELARMEGETLSSSIRRAIRQAHKLAMMERQALLPHLSPPD
jgi:Ribbon-helix-helix protein, copG family